MGGSKMKNCSQCKNWEEPEKGYIFLHHICKKQLCMTCREIGASYNADNDCFEEREEEK
jgi:hypothetical protein